jgi:hypothetical protein
MAYRELLLDLLVVIAVLYVVITAIRALLLFI